MVSAFIQADVSPFNPSAIPDYAFLLQLTTDPVHQIDENEIMEQNVHVLNPRPGCRVVQR